MYLNIAGMKSHFDELKLIIQKTTPKIIVLTETHLTEKHDLDEFQIQTYSCSFCLSRSAHTGGVAVYVDDRLKYETISNMAVGDNWFLAVDVKSSALNGIYGGIYHSPSSSDTEFIDSYEEWLRSVFADERRNVFVGDFNIRWNEPGCSRELKNVADAMGMRQIVLEPTRVGPTSSNIIDLVFTNMENAEARVVEELKVSDHETISIAIGNDTINLPEREESYVSWKRYSKDKLQEILRRNRSSNSRIDETIGEASRNFSTNLVSAVESLVDVRCCRRTETSDWYTDHLRAMKNERDNAYRQYRSTKSVPALEKYKLLRNAYVRGLKQAKNQSVEEEIRSCHGDSKKLWRCLKSLIQPGGKQHAEIVFGTG